MIAQTKLIVNEFLKTNASDKELADLLGISSSTIQRRLNDKKRIITAFYPDGERVYELVQKNLKLNKKRTMVTIIGIILSVALITAVAGVYFSGVESLIYYQIQCTFV